MLKKRQNIHALRKKIDKIDRSLSRMIAIRFRMVQNIWDEKQKNKLKFNDLRREREILNNIDCPYLKQVFKTIMSAGKKYVKDIITIERKKDFDRIEKK